MSVTSQGRLALITGSARGLGRRTAIALAEKGHHIVINYVNSDREARRFAQTLAERHGIQAIALQGDVSNRQHVENMMERIRQHFGRLPDILVNNAGPFIRERKCFADYTLDEVEYLIRGNLLGAMELTALTLPHMRAQRWGRILFLGFANAVEARAWPHRAVYAAAKVGLVSFAKTLAVEESSHGITVNMICPGDVRGDYKEMSIADVSALKDAESPRGRPGSGEDIARVVAFLCEDASDYITGNIINVTGGLDPIRPLPISHKMNQRSSE